MAAGKLSGWVRTEGTHGNSQTMGVSRPPERGATRSVIKRTLTIKFARVSRCSDEGASAPVRPDRALYAMSTRVMYECRR